VSDKQVMSDEEAKQLQSDLAYRLDRDRRDGGAQADVSRSYNDAWMDPNRMRLTADKRTALIVDPPDGRIPARVERKLTPEEEKERIAADLSTRRFNTGFQESYRDMDVGNRCIIRRRNEGGGHPYLPAIYNNMAQIFQAPGYVVIYSEMIHFARVIPVDGRPALPDNVGTWLGDPRGRWEGNTLVVETTNFNGKGGVPGNPILASKDLKIVERISRVEPELLRYEATINDPRTYTRPWTIVIPFTSPPGYQMFPYECHEGNLAVLQGLGGERAEDRALEEDARRGIVRARRPIQGGLTVGGQPIPDNVP
jgi:hypothetical protein